MHKFEFEFRLKSLIYLQIIILSFAAGLAMVYFGHTRIIIKGEKEPAVNSITNTEYILHIFPANSIKISPVTDIRFYTETAEDKSLITSIILYCDTIEHRLLNSKIVLEDSVKRNLYNDLSFFLQDPKQDKFIKELTFTTKFAFWGFVVSFISLLLIFSRIVNSFNKTLVKKQLDKTNILITNPVNVLLQYNKDQNLSFINTLKLTELDIIAVTGSTEYRTAIEKQIKGKADTIYYEGTKSAFEILIGLKNWLKTDRGYLIFITGDSEYDPKTVNSLLEEHKRKDSECTILTKEIISGKFPSGKIIRNVVNKIIKISEKEESFESSAKPGEIYAGLICFNISNLFPNLESIKNISSPADISLSKIIEQYFKNNKKVNSFIIKNKAEPLQENKPSEAKSLLHKTSAAVIISTHDIDENRIKNVCSALDLPEVQAIGIVIHPDCRNKIKDTVPANTEIIFSDGNKGQAEDIIKSTEWLKDLTGIVLIIPECAENISKELVYRIFIEHSSSGNTCTVMKITGGPEILFCFNSVHLYYALNKISSKNNSILSIANILKQEKRSVETIEIQI